MTEGSLEELPGIGPQTVGWLREVGITTAAELRRLGPVAAYRRLKHWNPRRVTRNALWNLYAALNGVAWNRIDPAIRDKLLREAGEQPD